MRSIHMVIFMLLCAFASGQANISVDRTEIKIGDQVQVDINIMSGTKGEWVNKVKIWPDSMQGIELVSGPETTEENPLTARYRIAFFDTGYVRIPSLPVLMRYNGKLDTIYTDNIPVKVDPVEPDSTGLLAIKDIYEEPFNLLYYKKFIPHAIVALIALASFVYWWRKRKKPVEEIVIAVPALTPHQWAFDELKSLEVKRLWQSGEVKEHYSLLTAILRGYLERRFGIHALEQTSDVIISQLKKLQLSTETLRNTESLLSMADLIKFAKADPGIDVHAAAIKRVEDFVKETADFSSNIQSPDTNTDVASLG